MWQTIIHAVFILSAIGIVYVDRLSQEKNYARYRPGLAARALSEPLLPACAPIAQQGPRSNHPEGREALFIRCNCPGSPSGGKNKNQVREHRSQCARRSVLSWNFQRWTRVDHAGIGLECTDQILVVAALWTRKSK